MEQQRIDPMEVLMVGGHFKLGRNIGHGSFGEIHVGTDMNTGEEVAIKVENSATKHPQLHIEAQLLQRLSSGVGIPKVRWSGQERGFNVMVMDLLGPSLEDLFVFCKRKFSVKTVLLLADQMLARIEYIHKKNYIHRDIKPDNFLMGLGKQGNLVYLIDFGLAKPYCDHTTKKHIDYRENKCLTGTARYVSVNTHQGIEQSRRDDLESLGYVLMYFMRGSLPWQGLRGTNKRQKYEKIREKKLATSIEELCQGFPTEFATYIHICRGYKFEETPNYEFLKALIKNLFVRMGFAYDFVFDWNMCYTSTSRKEPQQCINSTSASAAAAAAAAAAGGHPEPVIF